MYKSALIYLALSISMILGQTISGTVTDDSGNGLSGANITVKGTNKGAAADASGNFSISDVSPGTYTLTASFIGYNSSSQSVSVSGSGAKVNFSLSVSAFTIFLVSCF